MAKTVKQMPGSTNIAPPKYPWDKWLDGNIWEITSRDWECENARHFYSAAQQAAKRRGGRIEGRFPEGADGNRLVMQFIPEGKNGTAGPDG